MKTRPWAAPPLSINPTSVLSSIERGLTVSLIATFEPDLVCCPTNAQIGDLLASSKFGPFDYLPVMVERRIVGLLPLHQLRTGDTNHRHASDEMLTLDERRLISADVGILTFIELADEHPCRLVVRGTTIDGIVTLSDLQKLPVRPALFLLITHLELLMSETIRRHFQGSDAWIAILSPERQAKVTNKWERLNAENLAIDLISAAEFCDKRKVLLRSVDLSIGRNKGELQLKQIEKLRDSLAHSSDFA
jgi:hypothetical protein